MIAELSPCVAASGYNGKPLMRAGEKSPVYTPWEKVAWALLELAIEDTTILCRYGLIDRDGELKPWPCVKKRDKNGHNNNQWLIIANMRDPMEHTRVREFWNDPTQGQLWCDLCGCRLPATDIWKSILRHHAK